MKVLYFTESNVATDFENTAIAALKARGIDVAVRNRTNVGTLTEPFDGVSGTPPFSLINFPYYGEFDNKYVPARTAGMLGDSRFGLSNFTAANGAAFYKSMGLISWLQSASYGVLSIPETNNFGVAGENTQQILARTPAAITALKAAGANVCFYIGGTNDYTSGITDDQRKTNVLATLDLLVKAGLMPIVFCETPRRAEDPVDYINRHWNYRLWLKTELPKRGYAVVDVWPFLCDPANPKVVPANSTYDGQHGNPTQQQKMGLSAWRQMSRVFGSKSILPVDNTEYSAATPGGSCTKNPMMTGTTGNKAANANATGSIATNWNIEGENMAGLTVACSKETHSLYGETQVLRITGKSTSGADKIPALSFYQDPATAPANGEKYKLVNDLNWESKYDNLINCSLNMLSFPKYFSKIDGDAYSATTVLPRVQPPLRSRECPILTVDANTTGYRSYVSISVLPNTDVDVTIRISRFATLKLG